METIYTKLNLKSLMKIAFSTPQSKLEQLSNIAQYGDVVRAIGRPPRYFINDPETIHQVLIKNSSNYSKENTSFMKIVEIVAYGQLTNSGEPWQKTRTQMQPHFYHNNLPQVFPIINQYTDAMLDDWQDNADKQKKIECYRRNGNTGHTNYFGNTLRTKNTF